MKTLRGLMALAGALASIGCGDGGPATPAQDLVGLWQATTGALEMVCDGVATTRPFTTFDLRFRLAASGGLELIGLDATGVAPSACVYRYTTTDGGAILDGKQTCIVVTSMSTSTTTWFEDDFKLSSDKLTLDEIGTVSDSIGCTTMVTAHYTRKVD